MTYVTNNVKLESFFKYMTSYVSYFILTICIYIMFTLGIFNVI